jgi:hypothetical protein
MDSVIREMDVKWRLKSSGSGQGTVAGFFEHGDKPIL